jgi:hypothetical protein
VLRFQLGRFAGQAQEGQGGERVTLTIYDILGRAIHTVVDEPLGAGSYEFAFDAGGLSSGVYYASLHSAAGRQTLPLVVVR